MPSRASRYGWNCGSSVGQLGDAPPDAAEPGQHRVVALVQRRVALRAQPLDALGAGQHLPQRGQLDVLGRLAGFSAARSSSPS